MVNSSKSEIVPEQKKGNKTDTASSVSFSTKQEAHEMFLRARLKLLDVNHWHKLNGGVATFSLTDKNGDKVNRTVSVGDYFQIDVPGPASGTGNGYDWVQVQLVEDLADEAGSIESTVIKVRPASNPLNAKTDVAHFFSEEATSSFMLRREENKVTASVHGRNEKPNTEADTILDKARNALFAVGAILGFSSAQWKSLVDGIIKN